MHKIGVVFLVKKENRNKSEIRLDLGIVPKYNIATDITKGAKTQ